MLGFIADVDNEGQAITIFLDHGDHEFRGQMDSLNHDRLALVVIII